MSLLPRAASATDVVMNNVNPDAAATSGARQPTLLTDADLETSPEKRRKVCFAVCTLLLHTISMFSMLGESLYPHVPVRVSSVYVKVGERSENKNLRMTKSCTKSQPKATDRHHRHHRRRASIVRRLVTCYTVTSQSQRLPLSSSDEVRAQSGF